MLLYMIGHIVVAPPGFRVSGEDGDSGQPIGVPLYILFDLLINTSAGYDLFRIPAFNVALKDLLDSWGQYLQTTDSNKTLNEGHCSGPQRREQGLPIVGRVFLSSGPDDRTPRPRTGEPTPYQQCLRIDRV